MSILRLIPWTAYRSFASCAALRYDPRPSFLPPTITPAFHGFDIPDQRHDTWNNQVGDHVAPSPPAPEEKWREMSAKIVPHLRTNPPADAYAGRITLTRLTAPYLLSQGRSVKVAGKGFATAYLMLNRCLSRNEVRRTLRMTARHEKKGVKRRRITSEQWRKHFANEVWTIFQLTDSSDFSSRCEKMSKWCTKLGGEVHKLQYFESSDASIRPPYWC